MANRDWETAAYAGLVSSLKEYGERLDIRRNYKLNARPREIDCIIIDKLDGQDAADTPDASGTPDAARAAMDNDIARFFKRCNIIELKNPYEELNIDVVWKVISYASQYKSFGKDALTDSPGVDAIPMDSVTITFLRLSKPHALFRYLKEHGCEVRKGHPGIYYIHGLAQIDMQVVVGAELAGEKFVPLRIQKKNAADEDILAFVESMRDMDPAEREMADAILGISMSENRESYDRLTGEGGRMYTALRELMRGDFEQLEREADERVERVRRETAQRVEQVRLETAQRVEQVRRETARQVERETAQRVERETAQRVERETAQRVERETTRRVEREAGERMEQMRREMARKMLEWNMPMAQIQAITGVEESLLREMAAK